ESTAIDPIDLVIAPALLWRRKISAHLRLIQLVAAGKAAFADAGKHHSPAEGTRRRHISGGINVRLLQRAAQLQQDETRPIVIKAAKNECRLGDGIEGRYRE